MSPILCEGAQWTPLCSLKGRETTHLDSTGTSGAGVDGLRSISSPSVNFCCFIGHQVTKKHQCMSQSNFLRILGETPSKFMALFSIAHREHSWSPPPRLACSHLCSLSRPRPGLDRAVQCGN